ncbi:hypothetical protein LTR15_000082 [Elasticomyces elasticus]|nr:hypothetical protein LTR15_000082 [Elasticomyces elasticus]
MATPQQDHSAQDESAARAAAKVFAIPELLEMILLPLHQDTLQLFPLRRVNSTFHDLIRGSKVLRYHLKIPRLTADPYTRGFIFSPVVPVPTGMIDIFSPLDIFSTSINKIYVKLNSEWHHRFISSPEHTVVLLMAEPMSMKTSWREIVIAEGGDVRNKFVMSCQTPPWSCIVMEKGTTMGWLMDKYMAELRQLAVRLEMEGGSE